MIELMGKDFLSPKEPAFYDLNSKSAYELIANFHARLNELTEIINNHVENVNKTLEEFMENDAKSKEEHMAAMRQEYQDFIDVVNLKMMSMEGE